MSVLNSANSICTKESFIDEYDAIIVLPIFGKFCFQVKTPLFVLLLLIWINLFHKLNPLSLDHMQLIKLPQKCGVNAVVAEVSMKEDATLFQSSAYPVMECVCIQKKLCLF